MEELYTQPQMGMQLLAESEELIGSIRFQFRQHIIKNSI